jgi:hypothetical protein
MKLPTVPAEDLASNQSLASLRRTAAVACGLSEDLENSVFKALLLKTGLLLNYNTQQLGDGYTAINIIPRYQINKKLVVLALLKILILEMNGKYSGMIKQSTGKEMPQLGKPYN